MKLIKDGKMYLQKRDLIFLAAKFDFKLGKMSGSDNDFKEIHPKKIETVQWIEKEAWWIPDLEEYSKKDIGQIEDDFLSLYEKAQKGFTGEDIHLIQSLKTYLEIRCGKTNFCYPPELETYFPTIPEKLSIKMPKVLTFGTK